MASTITRDKVTGNTRYVEILFENASASSEHAIPAVFTRCTIDKFVAVLVSGTAVAIDPALGRVAGFAIGDFDEVGAQLIGAPAARVGTTEPLAIQLLDSGDLFVQPRPGAGADNEIRVELHIKSGWREV